MVFALSFSPHIFHRIALCVFPFIFSSDPNGKIADFVAGRDSRRSSICSVSSVDSAMSAFFPLLSNGKNVNPRRDSMCSNPRRDSVCSVQSVPEHPPMFFSSVSEGKNVNFVDERDSRKVRRSSICSVSSVASDLSALSGV